MIILDTINQRIKMVTLLIGGSGGLSIYDGKRKLLNFTMDGMGNGVCSAIICGGW